MMTIIKRLGWGSAWLIVLCLGSLQAADSPSEWKAGVARVDTTPTKPVRMAGYASRTAPSEGVAHPLVAKALALADGHGHKIVWVTCDIIWFRRAFTNRVAERVQAQYGLPRVDLALFASHNHAGPSPSDPNDSRFPGAPSPEAQKKPIEGAQKKQSSPNNVEYTKELEDKIVAVVGEALGKMEPVSVSYGVGRAHFALNRREPTPKGIKLGKYPAGPIDESVPILCVQNAQGKPLAVVFGYACHNTTLRPNMMQIAADYAGYAQDRIEADNPGATALFVTGCAGDADPHPFGTLEMSKDHGEELGAAVKFVLDHPNWLAPLTGSIRSAFAETTVHFAVPNPAERASYEKLLNGPNARDRQRAERMIEAIDQKRPVRPDSPYAVHAFALGDQLTMAALSGEVVVDYALRLQHELGGPSRMLWVAAYANDVLGYIPSVRVLKEGGYEATPFAEDIESIVVEAAHGVVKKVRERRD